MTGRNKFMLGAITGASALLAAIPFVVQMSSAASGGAVVSATTQQFDTDTEVPDAQEAAVDPSQAKITKDVAEQTALQAHPGQVRETKLESDDGPLVYSVMILNDIQQYEVRVDAVSGKVLSNKLDEADYHNDENKGEVDSNDNGAEVKDASGQGDAAETNEKDGQNDPNEQEDSGATQSSTASQH